MENEISIRLNREFLERAFNQGDLSVIDEQIAVDAIDHQEPLGTDFIRHLKGVVTAMRTAFPDLHFEIQHILADGDITAFHSLMTGTHTGTFTLIPRPGGLPATGRKISVQHMHFVRMVNGKAYDLWHVWDQVGLMQQLGMMPQPQQA